MTMFRKVLTLVVLWAVVFACANSAAGEQADQAKMQAQLQQALAEIQQLRGELAELKEDSRWQYRTELNEALQEVPQASAESSGEFILPAGWSIRPYGYIKGDFVYDDSGSGNVCARAVPENEQGSDDSIAVTARQTRLGVIVTAPNIGDAKVRGVVETDFYGRGGNENASNFRMRRAFGEVSGDDWKLLFGQEWELISPLYPDTLNFAYGSFSGNAGFRYPQFRFEKYCDMGEGQIKTGIGVQRESAEGNSGDVDGMGREDGSDSSWPSVFGRVGYHQGKFQAGLGGHIGEEEADWDYSGQDDNIQTWSLNADLVVPMLEDVFWFKGEFFWAENYDTHAGHFQGINATTRDAIEVFGGFAELNYKPLDEWKFTSGFGWVDPTDEDVNDADISLNTYYYGNAKYFFSKYLWTGLEVSYYATDYKNSDNGDNWRFQHSWALHF